MITTEYLANFIEGQLNANTLGKNFLVFADEGDMRKAKRCCKQYKYWTNCLLEVVSSTVTPIKNITFETATVQLMFIVDLAEAGQTTSGEQDREQSRNLLDVKQCIYGLIESLNGVTTTSEIGEKTYTITIGFGQPTDGQKTQLGEVAEALPIYLNMTFNLFENGINTNDCHIYVNGEDLYFTRCVITKLRTSDQSEFADSQGSKVYALASGKSVDLVVPAVNTNMGKAIMTDVLESENNIALDVELATPLYTKHFIGTFGNNSASMDVGSNVGFNVSLVEGKESLLSYDSNWALHEIDEDYIRQLYSIPDSEEIYPILQVNMLDKEPIYWGDGTFTESVVGWNEHTYRDGKKKHTAKIFNKKGGVGVFAYGYESTMIISS